MLFKWPTTQSRRATNVSSLGFYCIKMFNDYQNIYQWLGEKCISFYIALFSRKIQYILDDQTEVKDDLEAKLAVLTASERTTWANQRDMSFRNGINKASLDVIESAAFIVVLDDYDYNYDEVNIQRR